MTNTKKDDRVLHQIFDNLKTSVDKVWLTSKEVAVYLGISPKSIRDMVYKGFLTPYKPFGRKLYFKKVEIDRHLENSRHWGGN